MWRLILSLFLLSPTVFGCLRIQSTRPPTLPPVTGEPAMNGCKCPQITYATKESIEQNEYGAYLANREVTKPPVTIASDCEIIVEVAGIMENMYFMIFRDGAPPIFNKRLYDKQPGSRFVPPGISCEAVGDKFQWHNFGGPVYNMSIALQSNEEMCGCSEWNLIGGFDGRVSVPPPNITNLYETCDTFRVDCVNTHPVIGNFILHSELYGTWTRDKVWEDYTCVSGNWYHNGVPSEASLPPEFVCRNLKSVYYTSPSSFQCGCRDILNTISDVDLAATKYNIRWAIRGYTQLVGDPLTYATDDVCTPTFHCPSDTDLLAVYSMNYKPLYYENGALPQMSCRATPLATTYESVRYWFLEGVMLTEPAYACHKKDITTTIVPCTAIPKCVCSVTSINQNNVQSVLKDHPFLKNITSFILEDPQIIPDPFESCSKIFTCPVDLILVLLDKTDMHLYKKGASVPGSCNPYGQVWFVDDGYSEAVITDELFATCAETDE